MTSFAFENPFTALSRAFLAERARWGLWLPLPVAAGIVLYYDLPTEPSGAALLAPPLLALTAWLLRRRLWPVSVALFILALAALGFAAGWVETALEANTQLNRPYGPTSIQGRVAEVEIMPEGVRLTLTHPRVEHMAPAAKPESIRVKFSKVPFADAPRAGADIAFVGQIMPFGEPVAPGAFDFRRHAYYRHLGGMGWSYGHLKILDPDPPVITRGEGLDLALERARKTLARHVYEQLQGDVAAMTAARLNGEQTAISKETADALRIAGLTHLLAASGANVTVMGLLIYFPLRALFAAVPFIALRYPIKKWAACMAIASATFYTLMVGSPPAALRALLMSGLVMLAVLFDRRATPLRLLTMSTFLYLLLTPDALMGPSFQLSFAAVLALISLQPLRRAAPDELEPLWWRGGLATARHFYDILRSSLIATAATTPFCLYHFQAFSLYGFLANLLALPLTGFWIMPMTLIAYVLAPLGLDGFFIRMAGLGDALTIRIAQTVAAWPASIFYWPAMPAACLIILTLGGLWLCLWQKAWRWAGLLPILIGMAYPLYISTPDFFVSNDAAQWAAKLSDGRLAVSADLDKDGFIVRQWQQRLGNPPLVELSALPPDFPELRCDAAGCVYRHGDHRLALPARDAPQAALEDCREADIVVANVSIKNCAAPHVIDEAALWFHGAHTLHFAGEDIMVDYVRPTRGGRPWSLGYRKPFPKEEY